MKKQYKSIDQLGQLEAIQLRDVGGFRSRYTNVNWKQAKGIEESLKADFKPAYNLNEEHCGYTNIFTFLASLELDKDKSTQDYFIELGREYIAEYEEAALYKFENRLEQYFKHENNPLTEENSNVSSMLHHAICLINFRELAENVLEQSEERNKLEA